MKKKGYKQAENMCRNKIRTHKIKKFMIKSNQNAMRFTKTIKEEKISEIILMIKFLNDQISSAC